MQVRNAWNITEAILIKLQEEVALAGGKLLMFYIPDQVNIYPKAWKDTRLKYFLTGN